MTVIPGGSCRLKSHAPKGKYWCARWPSDYAVRGARNRIREHTARRLLVLPVDDIVERPQPLLSWIA